LSIVKVKLNCFVIVFVCILPEKVVPEVTYTVSGGTLNPTIHSLTLSDRLAPLTMQYALIVKELII